MPPFLTRRAAGLLTAAFLASSALTAPALAQTPPGVLVVGQIAEPQALDPHAVTAVNDFRILMNLYDGLVRYAPGTLEVEPALAEEWDISEDGTVYTFTLREGVTFHDGSALDAEAVVWNFDRMLDEDHPLHEATGPFPLSFFFSAIEEVEAMDDRTVRFTLNEPYAPFLSNLAYPTGLIVSPAAVEEHGEDFGRNPSGTGPFMFQEWRSNERVTVVRNPDYWDGPAQSEAVIFRPITDANTRTAEMLAGGIDIMVEVPPVALSQFQGAGFEIAEQAGPHVWFLILNAKEGPFADVRVRQAANYAINKEALVNDVLEGTATVAAGPIAPAFAWAYSEDLDPYPHDPDRARELLAQSGLTPEQMSGWRLVVNAGDQNAVTISQIVQSSLSQVGINIELDLKQGAEFTEAMLGGQFAAMFGGIGNVQKFPSRVATNSIYRTSGNPVLGDPHPHPDYVEAIAEILESQGVCRVVDLTHRFGVSHVTVTRIVSRLVRDGLARTEPYRPIELTTKGHRLAKESQRRHEIVYRFLLTLGVDPATARIDAEGIEHHVSRETLGRFQAFIDRGGKSG